MDIKTVKITSAILALTCLGTFDALNAADDADQARALQVLVITGGCCHDYEFQSKTLQIAAKEHGLDVDWTIVNKGGTGTRAQIDFYNDPQWADGFDVVIHNECFADTKNADYIRKITDPHKAGVSAVVIHCAMHTYRSAEIDDWREFLGVTSKRHAKKTHYPVTVAAPDHPIMRNFPKEYTTPSDELYLIEKVWPNTKVLATSTGEQSDKAHPVFWVNTYGKARVFGTTYGHSNETFADETFQETVVRGLLWAAGRL